MRRKHMEENHAMLKRHSALVAIRSRSITKTKIKTKTKTKHPAVLVAHTQSSVPCHAVFIFLIPVLLAVLQVHCQASDKSPFETHLPNMLSFLFSLLIYCLVYYYFTNITSQLSHPTSLSIPFKVSAHLALIFGSLAAASLISVLVSPHFEIFVFIIWVILIIIYFSINFIRLMMKWLCLSYKTAASYIFGLWKHRAREEQPL